MLSSKNFSETFFQVMNKKIFSLFLKFKTSIKIILRGLFKDNTYAKQKALQIDLELRLRC